MNNLIKPKSWPLKTNHWIMNDCKRRVKVKITIFTLYSVVICGSKTSLILTVWQWAILKWSEALSVRDVAWINKPFSRGHRHERGILLTVYANLNFTWSRPRVIWTYRRCNLIHLSDAIPCQAFIFACLHWIYVFCVNLLGFKYFCF